MAKSFFQAMKDLKKRGTTKGYREQKTERKKKIDESVKRQMYGSKSKKGKKA